MAHVHEARLSDRMQTGEQVECSIPTGIPIKNLNRYLYYKSVVYLTDSNYPGAANGSLLWSPPPPSLSTSENSVEGQAALVELVISYEFCRGFQSQIRR